MLTLRTFKVDVTPPVGDYLCGGFHQRSIGIETPLFLRGLVLTYEDTHYILAAIDFCYLAGRSQQRLVQALADGAKTSAEHVTLHSTHVHDAPLIDEEAHSLVAPQVPGLHNEEYFQGVLQATRNAVASALTMEGKTIAGVGFAQHPVREFAASRRVIDDDDRCHVRWSVCADEKVRAAPGGRIDPMLDQLVLYDEQNTPLACLHFYACHPQVSDGRRMISTDTIGVALDLFEKTNPGVFSLYFTGCAGDITAGKYTSTNRHRNRLEFGLKLFDGMQGAWEKAQPQPLQTLGWANHIFDIPLGAIPQNEGHFENIIRNTTNFTGDKYVAASKLLRLQRDLPTYPFRLSRLRLNDINLLFLPAEMVIDYQLFAKAQCAGELAVAAYGDGFLRYIATDAAFAQGGYEVEPMATQVDCGIQEPIQNAISAILDVET